MAASEGALVHEMMRKLRANGAYVEKNHGSPFSKGRPDLEGCFRGLFFAIEVKLPGGKPTALQQYVLNEIEFAGGRSYLLYSVEELVELLDEWKKTLPQRPTSSESG